VAILVELQQEYAFLCGQEKGVSFAELEIWSRLKLIYKAEKRAMKAEKKARKHGHLPSIVSEALSDVIANEFLKESSSDSEQVGQCLREISFQLMQESSRIRERIALLRTEIERLGGVVPNCSF